MMQTHEQPVQFSHWSKGDKRCTYSQPHNQLIQAYIIWAGIFLYESLRMSFQECCQLWSLLSFSHQHWSVGHMIINIPLGPASFNFSTARLIKALLVSRMVWFFGATVMSFY